MKKTEKPFTFRGKYLFVIVLFCYCVLFLVDNESAASSLQKSITIILKILPIITVVILFTSLINYFLSSKQIAAHLGRDSGIKGWGWALIAGVLSHGPMYIWYPMLEDLRSHGMKDALLVVFFASRTIKLPLLPMMVDYFGVAFTIILSLYIILGSILQGVCLQLLYLRDQS